MGIINKICKLANIDRINPDNVNLDDEKVWQSIRDDTSLIFQWNSSFGSQTMKKLFSNLTIDKIKQTLPNIKYLDLFTFGNALIRPCGKGQYNTVVNGEIIKTGISDIDNLFAPELGRSLYQEDIMEFVMKFCGYSFLDADYLRKCISKKIGTREQLPKISEGFINNAGIKYDLTLEKSNEIISPILQCILDATRYSFSKNHSVSYSCIGYMCGYLRYYYPLEYLTACLNIWKDNEDKTIEAIEYAKKIGISISEPKFRNGQSEYSFDKEKKVIYKGMRSVKYLNESCSNYLYSLKDNCYNNFTSLLYEILQSKNVDKRQLDVLIKLDFFQEFGNSKELLRVVNMFEFFKDGFAKSISKSKVSEDSLIYPIIQRNSKETDKIFTQLNTVKIIEESEELIKSWKIPDFSIKDKALFQNDYLGYINISTGEKEDRPKILVLKKRDLINNSNKKQWGVSITAQSIGSGKVSEYTILNWTYNKEPFNEWDCLYIEDWEKNKNGYFTIKKYYKIFL